jgi:VPDSG-CTERM motif
MLRILLQLALGLLVVGQLQAASILITSFEYGPTAYTQMQTTLSVGGNTVDIVDATTSGALAAALGDKAYDQVYLYDLSANLYLGGSDLSALASFWGSHKGLVVDSRSYGYYYQGTNASEMALLQNVESNFELTGGGVWVGTDHDPDWTHNGNAFLGAIGVNPITGIYSDPVNFADPSSVLLSGVTPTDLWGGGQSIGSVPLGVQPNGIEMFLHFGHINTDGSVLPYISASFPLTGPTDHGVPDSGTTIAFLGFALAGLAAARRFLAKAGV